MSARRIHELSARSAHPFVAVNCGALPETLIESELFGHERGAFTGAARTHHGCFERADKGTLLLDEIAEMPADMQVRLLRVLESGRFTRVGGSQEIAADVRVLAATNRALGAAVADGKLRQDLMYRLCVIPIEVPPLARARGRCAAAGGDVPAGAQPRARYRQALFAASRERIAAHPWPGNVRELRNVVYRAFVLCDGEVDVGRSEARAFAVAPAGEDARARPARTVTVPVGTSLEEAERALILATLEAVGGNKIKAADLLGISLKTLYNRLQAYRGLGSGAARPACGPAAHGRGLTARMLPRDDRTRTGMLPMSSTLRCRRTMPPTTRADHRNWLRALRRRFII